MFCEKCGIKIDKDAKFCQGCGTKVAISSNLHTPTEVPITGDIFYSKEWRRRKALAIASLPYFDVMADKKFLYLIRMPSYNSQAWGLFLGLFVFNLLGAVIGSAIGASSDAKKRQWYRSAWVDEKNNLTSHEYTRDVYMKIPLEHIKDVLVIKPKQLYAKQDTKSLILQKNKIEIERLNKFINDHVL